MQLVISNNNAVEPLSIDLSAYPQVDSDEMDPADPAFSDKVISHSLLKVGGALALEDLKNKELVFPLSLNQPNPTIYENLVPDPNFNYDATAAAGWPSGNVGDSLVVAPQITGGQSGARIGQSFAGSGTVSGPGTAGAEFGASALMPVTAGTSYYAQALVQALTLRTGAQGYVMVAWFATATQQTINGQTGLYAGSPISLSAVSASITATGLVSAIVTAPAGATYAAIEVGFQGPVAGLTSITVTDVMLGTGTSYLDGDTPGNYWTGTPGNSPSATISGSSAVARMVQLINRILQSPGAIVTWQDNGMSQPTTFDLIAGQFDIKYGYRRQDKAWIDGKLRLFTQPLGRTPGPRPLAGASGVGPLLLISPYGPGGALAVSPTQIPNGTTGRAFQAQGGPGQNGGGVAYYTPSQLQGDAPAQMVLSYAGPVTAGATLTQVLPYVAVSVLPDQLYQPMIGATQLLSYSTGSLALLSESDAPNGAALRMTSASQLNLGSITWNPVPTPGGSLAQTVPTARWAGQHRIFAIARASAADPAHTTAQIALQPGPATTSSSTPAGIPVNSGWQLADIGRIALSASQPPAGVQVEMLLAPSTNEPAVLDVGALIQLPDDNTWFLNPNAVPASQYGYPIEPTAMEGQPTSNWTNKVIIDDTMGIQSIFDAVALAGESQTPIAPVPVGQQRHCDAITPYTRGTVPELDPSAGMPIIAILGMGQTSAAAENLAFTAQGSGEQFIVANLGPIVSNPQNAPISAQIWVQERTRYVFS